MTSPSESAAAVAVAESAAPERDLIDAVAEFAARLHSDWRAHFPDSAAALTAYDRAMRHALDEALAGERCAAAGVLLSVLLAPLPLDDRTEDARDLLARSEAARGLDPRFDAVLDFQALALDTFAASPDWARIAAAVRDWLERRRERFVAAPAEAAAFGAQGEILDAMLLLARAEQMRGQLAEARAVSDAAVEFGRDLNDHARTLDALLRLGSVCHAMGDYDTAAACYLDWQDGMQSIAPDRAMNYEDALFIAGRLGLVNHFREDREEAARWYRRGLELAEGQEDVPAQAEMMHSLGAVAHSGGSLDEADRWYHAVLELCDHHEPRLVAQMAVEFHHLGTCARPGKNTRKRSSGCSPPWSTATRWATWPASPPSAGSSRCWRITRAGGRWR